MKDKNQTVNNEEQAFSLEDELKNLILRLDNLYHENPAGFLAFLFVSNSSGGLRMSQSSSSDACFNIQELKPMQWALRQDEVPQTTSES